MKNGTFLIVIRFQLFLIITSAVIFQGCESLKTSNLDYNGSKISYIIIDDSEESVIINESIAGIETVIVKNDTLFFKLKDSVSNELVKIGYNPSPYDPEKLFKKIVRLNVDTIKFNPSIILDDLKKYNIQYLNKEKDHWLIMGSIKNLKKLVFEEYNIQNQKGGIFPRTISVYANNNDEVEKINSISVDIHGILSEGNRFLIIAGAFDFQLEKIRELGFKINYEK